jgi:hypothetical protein
MNITIEQLECHLQYIACAIQNRSDGELYIPIFERLEAEIKERRTKFGTKTRIAMIAARGNSPKGSIT